VGGIAIKLLMVVFILDTILMVLAVLLQSGRGGGLAGALGGLGGAESALGTRATSTIAKITWVLGAIFLAVCLGIAWLDSSARIRPEVPEGETAPAAEMQSTQPPVAPDSPFGGEAAE